MICYVDIEHERWVASPDTRQEHLSTAMDIQLKLEAISGQPCLVQRYADVTRQRLRQLNITAVVISGNAVGFEEYPDGALTELQEIIREAEYPILGLCGGHELIGMAHGASMAPMRPLRPGEPETTLLSGPGYLKEWGYTPVDVAVPDAIFDGLGTSPVFLEVHYCELKQAPPGFQVLASTQACRIQAMRRIDKPVYGTQFHPEGFTEGPYDRRSGLVNLVYPKGYGQSQPDGRRLLANFFSLVQEQR